MKKISVIVANTNQKSFNHAIANGAVKTLSQNGYEVNVSVLA